MKQFGPLKQRIIINNSIIKLTLVCQKLSIALEVQKLEGQIDLERARYPLLYQILAIYHDFSGFPYTHTAHAEKAPAGGDDTTPIIPRHFSTLEMHFPMCSGGGGQIFSPAAQAKGPPNT